MGMRRFSVLAGVCCLVAGCGGENDTLPPPAGHVLYVDAAAPPGGNGSSAHPFRTVGEAFAAAGPEVDTVMIAGGTYPVPVSHGFDHTLALVGTASGQATVLMSDEGVVPLDWRVESDAADATVGLQHLELLSPLGFTNGALALDDVSLFQVAAPAIALKDAAATFADVTVSEVTASDATGGDGVSVAGGTFSWAGGAATGVPDRALVLGGGVQATIAGLTLGSADRAPLTVMEKSTAAASTIVIADVRLGVFVDDASLTLAESTVSRASEFGLLGGSAAAVVVTDSTFTDCPQGHVAVLGAGSSLTAERNHLSGAAQSTCLSVDQTEGVIVLRDNVIESCAGSGISLSMVQGAVIEGNEIRDIELDPIFQEIADGITLLDADVTANGNLIEKTAGYGISVIRTSGTIYGNTIGPVDGVGIAVTEQAPKRPLVKGNTITKAKAAGILVAEAEADLDANTVQKTVLVPAEGMGDGIVFGGGADVLITNNVLTSNQSSGILFFDGATGSIHDNEATGNTLYGIREFCDGAPSNVTIGDNTLDGNGKGPTSLCPE
jgi:parallel beta-helix repeat protein